MGGGGFVAGPAGLAAVLGRIPLVLTEADSHLGLANRLLAGRARRVCLAFPIAGPRGRALPGHRAAGAGGGARGRPRRRPASGSGSPPEARCLLVMGGSQGARSINECAIAAFAERERARLRRRPPRRAARLRGARAAPRRGAAQRALHPARLRARPRRLPRRLRPGAGPLGRLDLRADRGRAAGGPRALSARHRRPPGEPTPPGWPRPAPRSSIRDERADAGAAAAEIGALLGDEARLAAMAAASAALARPDAARRIADEVLAAAR